MRISDWSSDVCSSDLTLVKVSRFWLLALLVLSALVLGLLALFAKPRQLSDCDYERTGLWDLCKRGSGLRSEEHTSELQSLMRISYAVCCLKTTKISKIHTYTSTNI